MREPRQAVNRLTVSREAARTAILYAFDLIEHDGQDLRTLTFRPAFWLTITLPKTAAPVFVHACRLGAEGLKQGRRHLPVWPVPRLAQGPQSRQHRGEAGAERESE
jgi:hypothetical protein